MQQISLNLFQFIAIIVFIFVFSYFWIPKENTNKTDEYLILLDNFNKLKEQLRQTRKQLKMTQAPESTMGESISAHSTMARPATSYDGDNAIVYDMIR